MEYGSGQYVSALGSYQESLQQALPSSKRLIAETRVSEIRTKLIDETLLSAGYPLESYTKENLESSIEIIESRLVYDDKEQNLASALNDLKSKLSALVGDVDDLLSQAVSHAKEAKFDSAFEAIQRATEIDSSNAGIQATQHRVSEMRKSHFLEDVNRALSQNEILRARSVFTSVQRAKHPFDQTFRNHVRSIIEEEELRILPGLVQSLVSEFRYFEALQLLNSTSRSAIRDQFRNLESEAVAFYKSLALSARSGVPEEFGVAFFASRLAFMLNPEDPSIFEINRKNTEQIDEMVQSVIGVTSFNSPENEPFAGRDFSDSLIASLVKNLPYGIKILERSMMDKANADDSESYKSFILKNKTEIIVGGGISSFVVTSKINSGEVPVRVNVGEEPRLNPEYSMMIETYGKDLTKWPKNVSPTIMSPLFETIKYERSHETVEGQMGITLRLYDSTLKILESKELSVSRNYEDVYHQAIPTAGITEDKRDLPGENAIKQELRSELRDKVAEEILKYYNDRKERFWADFEGSFKSRYYGKAFTALASGYHFCEKDIELRGNLGQQEAVDRIAQKVFFDLADKLASFRGEESFNDLPAALPSAHDRR
jgi:tetratricopeptide (TPR) repeat protein